MDLRSIALKDQYRSDKDDLISNFFLPCLSNCIKYDRCIEYISIKSLITISFGFQNFIDENAKIRIITGNRFRSFDLNTLIKLFVDQNKESSKSIVQNNKIDMLKHIIKQKKIELKIAIPRSENLDGVFAEKLGIFKDTYNNVVSFSGTSNETFNYQDKNFESIDIFTSWNDKSRIETKINDFDNIWNNNLEYVKVYDFNDAERKSLLKYSVEWAIEQ